MVLTLDGRTIEPIDLDLVITRGEDWHVDLDWQQSDGSPRPVLGLWMALRLERAAWGKSVYPPDLTSDAEGGITLTDGHVALDLTGEQTAELAFSSTRCWIELKEANETRTWSHGRIRLRQPGGR